MGEKCDAGPDLMAEMAEGEGQGDVGGASTESVMKCEEADSSFFFASNHQTRKTDTRNDCVPT